MKKYHFITSFLICLFLFFNYSNAIAQWQEDSKYGFKINIPTSWSKNSYMDGTDKVYDFYSADENAAVQLRVFEAGTEVTTELLAQIYEENMLPAGTQKQSLVDHTSVNGIPGKQGLYMLQYNGNDVHMANFYTVQNQIGYVLTAIIPSTMLEQKGAEVKQITHSFIIDGFEPVAKSEKQTKGPSGKLGGLGGISGGSGGSTGNTPFKVTRITLADQIDANNYAVSSKSNFGTKTPEIHAVIEYVGSTKQNIVVAWIYRDTERVITKDAYTFDAGGGVGVVSLSKPNNDWPVGEYWIEFYMGETVFKEMKFTISNQQTGSVGAGSTNGNIAGKYNFIRRSDGKVMTNYHYIIINSNGTYSEKYNPKNSGDYVGGTDGTWDLSGNKLTLIHPGGNIKDYYTVNGNELTRNSSGDLIFTFRK